MLLLDGASILAVRNIIVLVAAVSKESKASYTTIVASWNRSVHLVSLPSGIKAKGQIAEMRSALRGIKNGANLTTSPAQNQ